KPYFTYTRAWDTKIEAQTCGTNRDGGVIDGNNVWYRYRRRDERIGVSCRFQIVDEIRLKVAADFEYSLCSRKPKKSRVLGIKRYVVIARSCDGILRELLIGGCRLSNLLT